MEVEEAEIVEVDTLAGPGMKLTVSSSVIATVLSVPVMTAVPLVTEEVKVAVYVPFPISLTKESVPFVVERIIVSPPAVRLFPWISFN
jgi:hypothetical protein